MTITLSLSKYLQSISDGTGSRTVHFGYYIQVQEGRDNMPTTDLIFVVITNVITNNMWYNSTRKQNIKCD